MEIVYFLTISGGLTTTEHDYIKTQFLTREDSLDDYDETVDGIYVNVSGQSISGLEDYLHTCAQCSYKVCGTDDNCGQDFMRTHRPGVSDEEIVVDVDGEPFMNQSGFNFYLNTITDVNIRGQVIAAFEPFLSLNSPLPPLTVGGKYNDEDC